jgi:hypothetical protein
VTFSGGTLADLTRLSPNLTFDELIIDGELTTPIKDFLGLDIIDTRIVASKLTITANGSIRFARGAGDHGPCSHPSSDAVVRPLRLLVSGDVVIDGKVDMSGRSGFETDMCCGGLGGYVIIHGNTITVSGTIAAAGGTGSGSCIQGVCVGCEGGNAAPISLTADTTMDLSGAYLMNLNGRNNFVSDKNGYPASIDLTAGAFKMWGGTIFTAQDIALTASSTDIRGANFAYDGTLNESVGGGKDTTPPTVVVFSPSAGSTLDRAMELRLQVIDPGVGVGVRTIRAKGPGGDVTFTLGNCGPTSTCTWSPGDNTLTATLPAIDPTTPATLELTATDNKGNVSPPVIVSALEVPVTHEVEPNACFNRSRSNRFHVQHFTLVGEVSQADDAQCRSERNEESSLWRKWTSGETDFCEDLVVVDDYFDFIGGAATPVVATLTWDGPQDLDLLLVERRQTCSVSRCSQWWPTLSRGDNPAGVNTEQVAAVVRDPTAPGDRVFGRLLCVTWYDPGVVAGVSVPFTLTAEIGKMVTFNLTTPSNTLGFHHVTGTSGTGPPFSYLVYTDDTHPDSVSAAFSTQPDTIQYHYTFESYDQSVRHDEADASCKPVTRTLTLPGGPGTQTVNDTVVRWQGVAPCP